MVWYDWGNWWLRVTYLNKAPPIKCFSNTPFTIVEKLIILDLTTKRKSRKKQFKEKKVSNKNKIKLANKY